MSRATAIKAALLIAVGITVLWIARTLPLPQIEQTLVELLKRLGPWVYAAFVLIYALATICLIPASAITLAAGAIFGLAVGFALVSAGSTLGAAGAFLIARSVARKHVAQLAQSNAKFRAFDAAIADGGWRVVALLRLSPAIPFTWQNYFYGLTSLRFWPYVVTSWIAMMPGTFMYVYLGHAAGATIAGELQTTGRWILLATGLVATVAVAMYITHLAKRHLNDGPATAHQQPNYKHD